MPACADRSGAETRDAIIATAASTFREKGYETATLGEIASKLGITRSAVLHHFESKDALLGEVIEPLMKAIDDLLDRREAAGRLTPRTRRPLLVELVDLICDHPDASAIIAFDAGIRHRLDGEGQISGRGVRLANLATTSQDDPHAAVRAFAALGAMLRPAYTPGDLIDIDDPAVRRTIVDCAMAVYSTAPRTRPRTEVGTTEQPAG